MSNSSQEDSTSLTPFPKSPILYLTRCNDPTIEYKEDCVGQFSVGETDEVQDRNWENSTFNFDDIGNALLTLFITVTQDGYNNILLDAMSVTEKDKQPKYLGNPGAFFFFMAFIMVCAFCLLNLYVGVVFYQFSRIRLLSQTGSAFLTSQQQVRLKYRLLV